MPEEISVALPDGTRLYAEAYGDPRAPVTLVLLHGWTLHRHAWHRQITALAGANGQITALAGANGQITALAGAGGRPPAHPAPPPTRLRVVAYDARGHGRSDPARRGTATLAQLGDDLAEVLR
ncbi:MAG: alpha/beta fold hydrolase, partial [Micromonosporaceae bacterium]|nr:alpha/beta fold hydrolase [Micromonosporaceae bacterium]